MHHICLTRKQHGSPAEVVDMGETAIDEETFREYINQLRDHYTADKVCLPVAVQYDISCSTVPSARSVNMP
jgi:hypothetical protein